MLRVAVCDNEEPELKKLEEGLTVYADRSEEPVEWISFRDPKKLKESLENGAKFDVALLDILMPEVSGIELGKYILEHCPDISLIYATTSRDFALDAYENHALRYLMKPVEQEKLFSALDFAKAQRREEAEIITIKGAEGTVTATLDQIVLVENVGRCAQYQLLDGRKIQTTSRRGKLDDLVAPIPERAEFMKPHKSFWVNMRHISEMKKEDLIMKNGAVVPISYHRQQETKRTYLKFLEKFQGGVQRINDRIQPLVGKDLQDLFIYLSAWISAPSLFGKEISADHGNHLCTDDPA